MAHPIVITVSVGWSACRPSLCLIVGGNLLSMGDQCLLLKLITLCSFSMRVKYCSTQCLCELIFLGYLMQTNQGVSWHLLIPGPCRRHYYAICNVLYYGRTPPRCGNRCHLLDNIHQLIRILSSKSVISSFFVPIPIQSTRFL